MSNNIIEKLKMHSREEVIIFLKNLWNDNKVPCPICKGKLDYLHKKAKKSNCDWICLNCNYRFDTIKILNELNDILK